MGGKKKELTNEDYKYIKDNYPGKATKAIADKLGITQNRVIGILRYSGIYVDPHSHDWTDRDRLELKKLAKEKKSPHTISKIMQVSENEVYSEANKLGIDLYRSNCHWTDDELNLLREYAGEVTPKTIAKKLNRSEVAVKTKMFKLSLSLEVDKTAYLLKFSDFADMMGISVDRVRTFEKLGLKTKKVGQGKKFYKAIRMNDILPFLESHQDLFDASIISEDLFAIEPKWLREKRRLDIQCKENLKWYVNKEHWTTKDIKAAVAMRNNGISDKVIAERLGRTTVAVQLKLREHGLNHFNHREWTKEEIDILKNNYKEKTDKELEGILDRTLWAIRIKRNELGLLKNRTRKAYDEQSA